ncbi:phage tail protein [Camelimonas lactis]|uniref:Minor tail protein Z (GPZ) n=1 Tax=Camelimonas lactis TaxID=659006 RepID=A0A4R2GHG3_9HYPH|nr:phage tail protein [Camelimonas lactis]TCO07594.1 minor tail protein Z (GPZ) [Camelimonas lactis]
MAEATVTLAGGNAIRQMADKLRRIGEREAREAASRAVNRGGDMAKTAMTRELVRATGINYQKVKTVMTTRRSLPATLSYTVEGRGNETNVGLFKARQVKRGASAAPWNKRKIFRKSFIVPAFGGKVYVRRGAERFPLKGLFGPNIAREMRKGEPLNAWDRTAQNVTERRLLHELGRLFK